MGKATCAAFAALSLLAAACGGSGGAEAAAFPEPTTVIADAPSPSTTPLPAPTATLAPTAEPTEAAVDAAVDNEGSGADSGGGSDELSEDEAAVIAAWERYLDLSIQARGKNPSAEALDYESYVIDRSREALLEEIAKDERAGRHITGTSEYDILSVVFREDGAAVISACWTTSFRAHSLEDDSLISDEGDLLFRARARLDSTSKGWRVAATEFEVTECVS